MEIKEKKKREREREREDVVRTRSVASNPLNVGWTVESNCTNGI